MSWTFFSISLVTVALSFDVQISSSFDYTSRDCYGANGPKYCKPPFHNAAFDRRVKATNTCGMKGPQEFCTQSGASGMQSICDTCDNDDASQMHPSSYITDYNYVGRNKTWWQSETLNDIPGSDAYPNAFPVNLTINLGTQFELTYIRIQFKTPRPASMVLYKKFNDSSPWEPVQYFSSSCLNVFGMPTAEYIPKDTSVVCVSKYSALTPLSMGAVVFSFLEGRPGSKDFFSKPELQRWVTASQIKIELLHLNTFGDELYRYPEVLRTYYYAVSDISIGGRCQCNGHGAYCRQSTGAGPEETKLYCQCEHNTTGQNCDKCKRGYHDVPWKRASAGLPNVCKPCNCSGNSKTCYFDDELYILSGNKSGGHCINCKNNTEGNHCEHCLAGFYPIPGTKACQPCACSSVGSLDDECEADGQCHCKPGVSGKTCDRCGKDHFQFSDSGCKACNCSELGSDSDNRGCDQTTGVCHCKTNVEGDKCDECLPGYFGLSGNDSLGCQPCFCFGHSSNCSVAEDWTLSTISVSLAAPGWKIEDANGQTYPIARYPEEEKKLNLSSFISPEIQWEDRTLQKELYYIVPMKFLGDRRASYNLFLTLDLSFDTEDDIGAGYTDIQLASGLEKLTIPLSYQENPTPVTNRVQRYRYRLSEGSIYNWAPNGMSIQQWMAILNHVTAIRIKTTYHDIFYGNQTGRARLHGISLETAVHANTSSKDGHPVSTVERCECPTGYQGQFCEDCQSGYRREFVNGGSFARCIPCQCNNHSEICEVESGKCECKHNTGGQTCEKCLPGFYGNATRGTENDCRPCPCPQNISCVETYGSGDVVCLGCPDGHAGPRCGRCLDGYFGKPPSIPCRPCRCNQNIDMNAVGNCDSDTGKCLRCTGNTAGPHCERCDLNFYGNATERRGGNCKACSCHERGSESAKCEPVTGQCKCRSNVKGKRCDQCVEGFYDLDSGFGCKLCRCDPMGTRMKNNSLMDCDTETGQCPCKVGVTGRTCDTCSPGYYLRSSPVRKADGQTALKLSCFPCGCSSKGAMSPECNRTTGQCECREHVEGRTCDQCSRFRHNFADGCPPCPACYHEIGKKVIDLEQGVRQLRTGGVISQLTNESLARMAKMKEEVDGLLEEARRGSGGSERTDELDDLSRRVKELPDFAEVKGRLEESLETCNMDDMKTEVADLMKSARRELLEIAAKGDDLKRHAREMTKQSGSYSREMEELAKDSRRIAARQSKTVSDLQQSYDDLRSAISALNSNISLLRRAQTSAEQEVDDFESRFQNFSQNFTEIERSVADIEAVASKSLELITEATKKLNVISPKVTRKALEDILKESTRLLLVAKSISKNRADQSDNFKMTLLAARKLYDNAAEKSEQRLIALQYATNVSKALRRDYDKLKEKIDMLHEALNESDQIHQAMKKKSQEAATMITPIRERIQNHQDDIQTVSKYLNGVREEVDKAKESTTDLRKTVQTSETAASKLKSASDELLAQANATKLEAEKMNSDAKDLHAKLQKENSTILAEREEVDEAALRTSNTAVNLSQAEGQLNDYIKVAAGISEELNKIGGADLTVWDDLERRVSSLEKSLKDQTYDKEITTFEKESLELDEQTTLLDNEVKQLHRERSILQRIVKGLTPCGERDGLMWKVGYQVENP